jgi:chorismate mutase
LESLVIRDNTSDNEAYKDGIEALRARIDVIDDNLLKLLQERMSVSRAIGEYKKEHNVAILQAGRWEEVLSGMIHRAEALGISEQSITAIMTAIHDESVRVQRDIF